MQYDVIALDMFNLYHRKKNVALENDPISIARNMVTFINTEVKQHLTNEGKLFLLYDPIPKTDLGLSKTFKYTERQEIVHAYKQNRVHDRQAITVVDLVRKYFLHRGPNVVSVLSDKFEADDFIESIVKDYPDKDILMVTNDEDFCRYLSPKVEMMNWDWDKMLTVTAFEEKYGFTPSIAGVCVWKACFGDGADTSNGKIKCGAGSDNIKGALQVKGLKKANDVKLKAFEYIKYLGEHPEVTVKDIEDLSKISSTELFKKKDRTLEEEFIYELNQFDPKYEVVTTFFSNMRVVQSRCDDYKKFAKSKDVDDRFNTLIEKTLGFNVKEDRTFKFGMIKG